MAPKKGKKPKAKKIFNNIKKQEKKIAKKEVKKAKTMIKKKHKWTVAASALGWHAGYSSKQGLIFGKGGLTEKLQTGVHLKEAPARSTNMFSPYYTRLSAGKDGMIVAGLQKLCYLGYDDTKTSANKQWAFLDLVNSARMASIQVNPDAFNGTITQDAQHYEFFKFKRLKLVFVIPTTSYTLATVSGGTTPVPSTLDNVNVAVGYFGDSEIANVETVNYVSLQSSNNMFEHQLISPWGAFEWTPKQIGMQQVKWKNTELQTNGPSEDRMCCQGIIYGFFDQGVASSASGSPTGASAKIGDVYVEYVMALKGRIATNGITVEINNRDVARQQYLEFKRREMKMNGDEQSEKDYNKICKRYSATMKALKKLAFGSDPVPSVSQQHTHVVIVDEKYDGSDSKQTVSVTNNQINCVSSSSLTQDVNVKQVGGTNVSSNMLETNLNIGGVPVSATKGVPIQGSSAPDYSVSVQPGASFGVTANITQINGNNISTDAVPINLTRINGNDTSSLTPNGGKYSNATIPVSIMGCDTTGLLNAVTAYVYAGSSGTSSTGTTAAVSSVATGASMEGPPSPTESLDTVIVKKKDYKEALNKGIKLQLGDDKKKDQKGPKGPSDEEEPDIEDTAQRYYDAHYGNVTMSDYLKKEAIAVPKRQERAANDPTWFPEYLRRFNGYMEIEKYQKGYGHLINTVEIGNLFDG